MTSDEQIRAAIAERASEWFVASEESAPGAEESEALVVWLKASPLHVAEFLRVAAIARDLRAAPAEPHSVETLLARAAAEDDSTVRPFWSRVLTEVRDAQVRRWQSLTVAVAALAVATLGFLFWWNLRPIEQVSVPAGLTTLHFETRHGEQQTHRVADNSVLHLNTDTAITIRYSRTERLITLASGQAGFEVAHESERPFRVLAGPAEVIARGTKFDVRLRSDATVVTVVEGRVAVEPAPMREGRGTDSNRGQQPRFIEVGADQQVTVSEGEWPATPVAVNAQHTTAWLHRQIAFDHEPLQVVAAEFNRYAAKPVEITAPELRNLQVTGVFSTDDPEAFIAFLRSLEGVRVDETATRILVSKK